MKIADYGCLDHEVAGETIKAFDDDGLDPMAVLFQVYHEIGVSISIEK